MRSRTGAHALAVVPQNLDQTAAPAAEHEQMATVRITLQRLLHQQRKAVKAPAHVGVMIPRPKRASVVLESPSVLRTRGCAADIDPLPTSLPGLTPVIHAHPKRMDPRGTDKVDRVNGTLVPGPKSCFAGISRTAQRPLKSGFFRYPQSFSRSGSQDIRLIFLAIFHA